MPGKNIIIFGETGCGKSSLVNMLLGQHVAEVGTTASGITFDCKKCDANIFGQTFAIFDTAGLNETTKGKVPKGEAISKLFNLIKSVENGISLLIFCMRGRIKDSTTENYQLFYEIFCASKVPVLLVVTGLEEIVVDKQDLWWEENMESFTRNGMRFTGVVCGCTTKGKREVYADEFNATKLKLESLIQKSALATPWKRPFNAWFGEILRQGAKKFPRLLGDLCWEFRVLYNAFLEIVGVSKEEAREMASKLI